MNEFKKFHPIVNLVYFASVIGFSMVFINPICLIISLVCAIIYPIMLIGRKSVWFNLKYMLPVLIISALINPAFNHKGTVIIAYLPSGNPLTLESVIYGLAAAVMIAAVINWFSAFNEVMTSDKLIYLFGRIIPSLSLVLSMALRFVPRFKEHIKEVSAAQAGIYGDLYKKGLIAKTKGGLKILSVMITWSFENAIDTADSMKSRGYGLHGRTAFSNFCFECRDFAVLAAVVVLAAYVLIGRLSGGIYFRYFPSIKYTVINAYSASIYAAYFLLCGIPIIIEVKEALKWKALKSKI